MRIVFSVIILFFAFFASQSVFASSSPDALLTGSPQYDAIASLSLTPVDLTDPTDRAYYSHMYWLFNAIRDQVLVYMDEGRISVYRASDIETEMENMRDDISEYFIMRNTYVRTGQDVYAETSGTALSASRADYARLRSILRVCLSY